jgi:hypothetical protein
VAQREIMKGIIASRCLQGFFEKLDDRGHN